MLRALFQVVRFVIRLMGLPQFPRNREPAIRKTPIGVTIGLAMRTPLLKVGIRPDRFIQ